MFIPVVWVYFIFGQDKCKDFMFYKEHKFIPF